MEDSHQLRVLVVAYYQHDDPLFKSVLYDYFEGMVRHMDMQVNIMTFEETGEQVRNELNEEGGIHWHPVRTGSWNFKMGRKLFDFLKGLKQGRKIAVEKEVDLIYSEGFPGAIIGYHIARKTGIPHVVHTYEPHSKYMVEAGVWSRRGWEYRILSHYEEKIARTAALIITGSERMKNDLEKQGIPGEVLRIPSSIDLDLFTPSQKDREKIRQENGIPHDALVFVYLGKFGGMYYDRELFEFFQAARDHFVSKDPFMLVLTLEDPSTVKGFAQDAGVDLDRVLIKKVLPSDVPAFLSAGDVGVSGMRRSPSKVCSSPIKHAEYWGCGLPLLVFRGVSEDDSRVEEEGSGVVIEEADPTAYKQALERLESLLATGREGLVERCRNTAKKERSLVKARDALQRGLWRTKRGRELEKRGGNPHKNG